MGYVWLNGTWTSSETGIAIWESRFAGDDGALIRLALIAWEFEVGPIYGRF